MSPPGIRRILVAVDSSPLSLAAADSACHLALRLGARLDALFIEDVNLMRLVAHPHVHTVSRAAARREALDDTVIERTMARHLVAARGALEQRLAASGAQGSFSVRRGRVEVEVLAAALDADLVCLGWSGRSNPGARSRLGSVARQVACDAAGPVLVARHPEAGPLLVWWDGTQPSRRAMDLAVEVLGPEGGMVDLLVPAEDAILGTRLAVEAVEMLEERGLVARIRAVGRLPKLLASLSADGLLVVAAEAAVPLDAVPCSALIVR